VGTIVGHFGVAGEVKVAPLDADAFEAGRDVIVEGSHGERLLETTIASVRPHQQRLLVRFAGVSDADGARALRDAHVLVDRGSLDEPAAGEFRAADLSGFDVLDARLGSLGAVRGVRRYPACDMLVVGDAERLIPILRAYGFKVDHGRRVIEVSLPPGFEEL
jgi:16S rRNA processing protein RimM